MVERRTWIWWRLDAPGHVFPQRHALALADVPLPLQVLLVRDAQAAPARAGGGRAADRPRRPPEREGAARADRRGARGAGPPGRARLRGLRGLRRVGVRAGAGAR